MVSKNNSNNNTVLATLALMLLSLSVVSIAISTPHYANAQGVLEGLEREQSDEALPGDQPADIAGPTPLNATTTIEEDAGNATNATMTGAAGNATNAGDNATTAAGGNQTGGSPT